MPSRLGNASDDLKRRKALKRTEPPATAPESTSANAATASGAPPQLRASVDSIARHPLNPRGAVNPRGRNVAELADSMAQVGVLQPLLVVSRAAFVAARPDHAAELAEHVEWVLVAGERRLVAASQVGLPTVPISVVDRLVDNDLDVEAMIVENVQREDLTPLQEARAYRLLVERGDSQRVIASHVGRAQSHIAKRLSLLKLPQAAQDMLAEEKLGVKDAETLGTSVPAADIAAVWEDATKYTEVGGAVRVSGAITRYQAERDRQAARNKAEKATRKKAEDEGLPVVTDDDLPEGITLSRARLWSEDDIEAARTAGTLGAAVDTYGELAYVDTAYTATTAEKRNATEAENRHEREKQNERQRKEAATARRALLAALATEKATPSQLAAELADSVIARADTEMLRLASKVMPTLGASDSAESLRPGDYHSWRKQVVAASTADRITAARLIGLARQDGMVHSEWSGWGREQVAFIERLIEAGYIKTAYDDRKWPTAEDLADEAKNQGEPMYDDEGDDQ